MIVRVPGDKSITQRALILAGLAEGESRLAGLLGGADPRATAAAVRALGVEVPDLPPDGSPIVVRGRGRSGLRAPTAPLDLQNSGTGARLLLGILAGRPLEAVVTGDASLRSRPMRRITEPLTRMGARFEELEAPDRLPIRVHGGPLSPLTYDSPVASAQVKSALLFAGLSAGVPVTVREPNRSRDHSERLLHALGARVRTGPGEGGRWQVELPDPPDRLAPLDLRVPGDPSSAAFLLAAAALGAAPAGLCVREVGLNPTRTGFLDVLRHMGVALTATDLDGELPWEPVGDLVVDALAPLRAVEVGGDAIPALIDEIPILAVLAARAEGVTRITGARELRVKETDRLRALAENLRAVGVEARELEDGLEIEGTDAPLEGRVRAFHDHRIAMAFGVLGAQGGNAIEVDDPAVADVSFPGFWALLEALAAASRKPGPRGRPDDDPDREEAAGRGPVVTIDGPAGSGKSTTAREVARRLGFRHLDSGALYRAVTYALLQAGVPEERWGSLSAHDLARLGVRAVPVEGDVEIHLGERRLTRQLRGPDVTARVSQVARLPEVRRWLLGVQRELGRAGSLVADGRDMGTVVFPDAEVKVFLVADLEERARRRLRQDGVADPDEAAVRAEAARIRERDRVDSEREHSPLRRPDGALEVDTTGLDFEAQVQRVLEAVAAVGR